MFRKWKERYETIRLIRNGIDSYPGGICFANASGRPVLVNKKMNEICYRLTGSTLTNAFKTWDLLAAVSDPERIGDLCEENPSVLACRLSDGAVWQFQRQELILDSRRMIQYEASDITRLYQYKARLSENNARVVRLHERQRELIRNIMQNNLEKELLSAKMQIHDQFGRCLILTKNELEAPLGEAEAGTLFSIWENAIADMENATSVRNQKAASPQQELLQVAEMIGCRVIFLGNQPTERRALLLLYAGIREALTNAVRHAGADEITVSITEAGQFYQVEIANNGRSAVSSVIEGSGLRNLRKRLEREGAAMEVRCENGVVLVLTIPKLSL